jgi:hypothetical protein
MRDEAVLRTNGFIDVGNQKLSEPYIAYPLGAGGPTIIVEKSKDWGDWSAHVSKHRYDHEGWESSHSFARAVNAIRWAVGVVNDSDYCGASDEIMKDEEATETNNMKNTDNLINQIKPGRYYVLMRREDGGVRWIGRWLNKMSETVKAQMSNNRHVAYDFSLPEGEDIISSTLEIRELADMHNRLTNKWPKLVAERRREYREYSKLDKVAT